MIRFKQISEQVNIKSIINEYKTGSGKLDPGEQKSHDDDIGRYISKVINAHESSGITTETHPLYDIEALTALKNMYIAKNIPSHPEHKEHADTKNYKRYREVIRTRYPHLLEYAP